MQPAECYRFLNFHIIRLCHMLFYGLDKNWVTNIFTSKRDFLKIFHFFLNLGYQINDLNGANSTGFMIAQMTSKNGIRMSAARAYIRPVQKRPNLHILLNTTVARVLVHPQTKSTHGVEIIDEFGHPMKIFTKKEVIVSGGAVNSPQILLLSGIGPKEDLTKVRCSLALCLS